MCIFTAVQRFSFLLPGLMAFLYVAIRAFTVGITFDEAWTISDFVPQGWWDLITYRSVDANNHLLNTLLIKIVHWARGKSLFAERLPNVGATLVYLYFAGRISMSVPARYYGYALFLLLLANPFVLDFFSLARGYGLALAFQLGSLYYLFRFARQKEHCDAVFSITLGALSVLSNFSFLTFFTGLLLCTWSFYMVAVKDGRTAWFFVKTLLPVLLLLLVIYQPLRRLAGHGMLYYGGTSGFYEDTLLSLTAHSMYETLDVAGARIYLPLFLSLFAVVFIAAAWNVFQKGATGYLYASLSLALLLFPVVGIIVQAVLLDGLFPHDRAVIYLLPLAATALVFLAETADAGKFRLIGKMVLGVVVLGCMLNFAVHANSYKTVTWYFDAHTQTVLEELEGFARPEGATIQLSSSWPLRRSIGYYLKKQKDSPVQYQDQLNGRTDAATDFYLYLDNPLKIVEYNPEGEGIHQVGKDTVLAFPPEGICLFSIRQPDTLQTRH